MAFLVMAVEIADSNPGPVLTSPCLVQPPTLAVDTTFDGSSLLSFGPWTSKHDDDEPRLYDDLVDWSFQGIDSGHAVGTGGGGRSSSDEALSHSSPALFSSQPVTPGFYTGSGSGSGTTPITTTTITNDRAAPPATAGDGPPTTAMARPRGAEDSAGAGGRKAASHGHHRHSTSRCPLPQAVEGGGGGGGFAETPPSLGGGGGGGRGEAPEERFMRILLSVKHAGFEDIDAMILQYYTARFRYDSVVHWTQKCSRRTERLQALLGELTAASAGWPAAEARRWQDAVLETAGRMCCEAGPDDDDDGANEVGGDAGAGAGAPH
ncbi:hypothetical protein GGR56DRAFT_681318 [Xylariaceae sp. FL0804]|nr:hypothetical protein GGR56DRAFT_681318 [Xylariaceae sp. FL0804]